MDERQGSGIIVPSMESQELPILGQFVDVQFPEWEGVWMRAKVDTGAETCAVHAQDIREEEVDGVRVLLFSLTRVTKNPEGEPTSVHCRATQYESRGIRNSFGVSQERFAVIATLVVHGKTYQTLCTLADRAKMNMPMLIGSSFIRGQFLVDPQQ